MWTIPEVCYAISQGDIVEEIYEVMAYYETAPILKRFLDMVASYKIRHSKFEEKNPEKLKLICDQINSQMNFSPEVALNPTLLKEDENSKNFYKLVSNAMIGKFSQENEKLRYYTITTQQDLDSLYNDPYNEISELINIGNILQVGIKPKLSMTTPNRNTNVIIGAYVTSYARIEMHKHLNPLLKQGIQLLYSDTDSALLKLRKNQNLTLPMGNSYGEWKDEVPTGSKITHYYALGPKSYCYRYVTPENKIKNVIKCKGFSLGNPKFMSLSDMENMVKEKLQSKETQIVIPQFQIRTEKKSRRLFNAYIVKTLSSDILRKRSLDKKSGRTFPLGFSEELKAVICETN